MVRLFYTFLILYGGSFDNVLFHNSVYFWPGKLLTAFQGKF
jgi:hypothetical protein